MMSDGEFSVAIFFDDGGCEYFVRFVDPETAVRKFKSQTETVGARLGTTRRVIVTDGGDFTNMEWKFGEGITYPPELAERIRGEKRGNG